MTSQDPASEPPAERPPENGPAHDEPVNDGSSGLDAEPPRPARKPLNLSGWIALVLASVAFGGSVLIAWPAAVLLAALALALSITGVVRVYRGRATNRAATFTALALAIATVILGFVWANRAQPCIPLSNSPEKFNACYEDRTGLL